MYQADFPVVDFHNDLLSYLTHQEKRTPYETKSLSSVAQFNKGLVRQQVLAISAMTSPESVIMGSKQVLAFNSLLTTYSNDFTLFNPSTPSSKIQIIAAIENASAFALEDEPIHSSIARLEKYITHIGPLVYISLTWNGDNRFGGGCGSFNGLKEDGKHLLQTLNKKNIAIDFSHASDRLAYEILEYIDKHHLNLPVMASHSNFRSIYNMSRNLPEDLAKEIIRRKGLICLNLFAPFVGESPESLLDHIYYGISLGGTHSLALGGDFFCIDDFPHIKVKYPNQVCFFSQLADPSYYPDLFSIMKKRFSLEESFLKKLSHENALNFLDRLLL